MSDRSMLVASEKQLDYCLAHLKMIRDECARGRRCRRSVIDSLAAQAMNYPPLESMRQQLYDAARNSLKSFQPMKWLKTKGK